MESPDVSYVSSPDVAPTASSSASLLQKGLDDKEKSTYIRFLVSNAAAGSVIGKGGATVTGFQSQSGARIQLSRNHEFFPGTSDRIIMITGTFNEIVKAMELILSKLLSEARDDGDDLDPRLKVRLIVPNNCCGCIIGRGGSTIKSFIEDSHADIKISPQDHNFVGLNDRLVTLSGSLEEQIRAIILILSKLAEDSHYSQSVFAPFSYTVLYNAMNFGPNGSAGKFQNNKGLLSSATSTRSPLGSHENHGDVLTFGVADEHIGAVVGRGGKNITEICQASGARIKISERGDFVSGTSDRKVTITGSGAAIRMAEAMILQKISSVSVSESEVRG